MVALWQCYGFCHGVLNTDNMSILGVTIDYGPFAWMEHFDPDFICNHSDKDRGRYKYKSQPSICKWNLLKLAEALDPVLPFEQSSAYVEQEFDKQFTEFYNTRMAQKLGFILTKDPTFSDTISARSVFSSETRPVSDAEKACIDSLFRTMA